MPNCPHVKKSKGKWRAVERRKFVNQRVDEVGISKSEKCLEVIPWNCPKLLESHGDLQ